MDAKGQGRNKVMTLGHLKDQPQVPVSVLGSPYNANIKEGPFKTHFQNLIKGITDLFMVQVQNETQISELPTKWIRKHIEQQLEENIGANYKYLRKEYNIFAPFTTENNKVSMTLLGLQEMVMDIYTDPETGLNAFIKNALPELPIIKVEEDYISELLLDNQQEAQDKTHQEEQPKNKKHFGILSTTELNQKLHSRNIDRNSITSVLGKYSRQVEGWDLEFFRRSGIFGPPEKTAHMEIEDFTSEWNEARNHILEEVIDPIEGFVRKLIHHYKLPYPFSLQVRNELLNSSPMEMLSYIQKEDSNPKLASIAQTLLTLTMEYILTRKHPDYKNASLVNFQLDHLAPHDGTYSFIRWDTVKRMWALDPKVHGTGWTKATDDAGNTYWVEPSKATNGNGNGNGTVNHTDETTLGAESMERLASIIDGGTDTTPKKLEWRCWMDPNNKRQTPVEYPFPDPLTGEPKQVKFYLSGRGMKGIIAILSKLHTRKWSFKEIYDLVRSRLVLNVSKEEIENPRYKKEVQKILYELAHDLAQNMYYLVNYTDPTTLQRAEQRGEIPEIASDSYTIENDFTDGSLDLEDEEAPKIVQKGGISSRLWKVFKILGRSDRRAPLEAQLVPHDVYCLDLSQDSPVSHGWYEVDRYLDFIQSILPFIYFSKEHEVFNAIRDARQLEKERLTREWEIKLGLPEGAIAA